MKRITYNFFYDGRAISKQNFEAELGKNWKKKCVRDEFGSWHCGYFDANPRN